MDWKYSGSETAGSEAARAFLEQHGYPEQRIQRVVYIIAHLGFKNQLAKLHQQMQNGADQKEEKAVEDEDTVALRRELHVVQDADRLDAIGAIGVARCLTFGGAHHRVLYDPDVPPVPADQLSKEVYTKSGRQQTSLNHFYEKLFRLKDLMNTESARRIAQQRDAFMHQFVDQFLAEWDAVDSQAL
eukprot:TRINITY_DN4179_c0_g1_i2.p1 TRINITY_DN4179_c0_g1~~TRINITY_DN4179_c0_g1_i2.p1  ORF type:complete len:186 (+),score=56.04 TRINITY_DN4179_c0_g1_i2:320-877(+)